MFVGVKWIHAKTWAYSKYLAKKLAILVLFSKKCKKFD